jgi:tripartite-type tricarboxylate transporter receptor subunit TctC
MHAPVPDAARDRVAPLLAEALADPAIAARIRGFGLLPARRDRAAFATAFVAESRRRGEVIRARGIGAE